jgi:5-methylcytosine-specific restriction protein A
MTRREFPARVRVAAYQRAGGHCEDCRAPLQVGRFAYDHIIPDGLGGEPTLENCMVLCRPCHGAKTAGADVPKIAKAKRLERGQAGVKKPPAFSHPTLRRKINGKVVPR